MLRRSFVSIASMAALGVALLPTSALAQQKTFKEQITGTWTIVSNNNVAADNTKRQLFGANPKGYMVLSPEGRYVQIITSPDRAKFKAQQSA